MQWHFGPSDSIWPMRVCGVGNSRCPYSLKPLRSLPIWWCTPGSCDQRYPAGRGLAETVVGDGVLKTSMNELGYVRDTCLCRARDKPVYLVPLVMSSYHLYPSFPPVTPACQV